MFVCMCSLEHFRRNLFSRKMTQDKNLFIKHAQQYKQDLEHKYRSESDILQAQINTVKHLQRLEATSGDVVMEEIKDVLEQLELLLNQYKRKQCASTLEKIEETFEIIKKLDCFKQCE